jgi:hypothetical protein
MVELQHRKKKVGAIPPLPRPITSTRGKLRVQNGAQLWIVQVAIRKARDDLLGG